LVGAFHKCSFCDKEVIEKNEQRIVFDRKHIATSANQIIYLYQMKKTILILGGIALLILLLTVRVFFRQKNGVEDERKWFARSLRYEFSARVDSVRMFNENSGRLRCRLTSGKAQMDREDSLKRLFKQHDMLYLIFKRSADTITFVLPNHAKLVAKGDSVRVSSHENKIQFFRAGKPLVTDSLSEALTGYSRPFFIKKK
jgi:hypothetical protein